MISCLPYKAGSILLNGLEILMGIKVCARSIIRTNLSDILGKTTLTEFNCMNKLGNLNLE